MMRRGVSRAAAPKSRGPVAHRAEFPYSQGRGKGYNFGLHNKDWGSRPMRADLRPVGAKLELIFDLIGLISGQRGLILGLGGVRTYSTKSSPEAQF